MHEYSTRNSELPLIKIKINRIKKYTEYFHVLFFVELFY